MNLTKNEVLDLLVYSNAESDFNFMQRVTQAYDELVHSEVEFPCVVYYKKGKQVWASNRVEKGAERISLEVYQALRPGYLSSKYPSQEIPPHQKTLEL